jgi:hypothetical protein
MFEEPTIYIPPTNTLPIKFFQKIGIISVVCNDYEWTRSQAIKLFVLSFVLISRVPSQHYITQPKILWLGTLFKGFLHLFLVEL